MLCYAKSLQSCPTLCNAIDGSHQAPPSLGGFSRQEHWSGLPFPSPTHESEKWKRSHSVMSDSSRPHGLQPTRLFHPWDFPGKSTGVGCHHLLRLYIYIYVKKRARKYACIKKSATKNSSSTKVLIWNSWSYNYLEILYFLIFKKVIMHITNYTNIQWDHSQHPILKHVSISAMKHTHSQWVWEIKIVMRVNSIRPNFTMKSVI